MKRRAPIAMDREPRAVDSKIQEMTSMTTSRSDQPMMVCGHTANGLHKVGDGYEPACVICSCYEQASSPDLTGRTMRCSYFSRGWGRNSGPIYPDATKCSRETGCQCEHPSDAQQPFFEFRGEGSKAALTKCKNCAFSKDAHEYDWPNGTRVSKKPPKGMCSNFEPHGAWDFDAYYCGCFGWD